MVNASCEILRAKVQLGLAKKHEAGRAERGGEGAQEGDTKSAAKQSASSSSRLLEANVAYGRAGEEDSADIANQVFSLLPQRSIFV